MLWLLIAISGYFSSALVALLDKYLLKGAIPSAKIYTFYVGILGILGLFLIPFGFFIPEPFQLFLALISGALFTYSLFWFFKGLHLFEVSRIVPAIGALTPLFTFGLIHFFSDVEKGLGFLESIAFLLLISGSVLISIRKDKLVTFKSFQISAIAAFLFSLSFVLAKFVYLSQPFWSGFIWMRIGGFIIALFFLFSKEVRQELLVRKKSFKSKTAKIFVLGQTIGTGSLILHNWAIALVPLGFLPFVSALEGTKYVFLLIFTILLALKFPKILKEEITKKVLFQKILAILLIILGMVILTLR